MEGNEIIGVIRSGIQLIGPIPSISCGLLSVTLMKSLFGHHTTKLALLLLYGASKNSVVLY
jgi:hypothetical protein